MFAIQYRINYDPGLGLWLTGRDRNDFIDGATVDTALELSKKRLGGD